MIVLWMRSRWRVVTLRHRVLLALLTLFSCFLKGFAMFANIAGDYAYNIGTFIILLWAVYRSDDTEPLFVSAIFILLR